MNKNTPGIENDMCKGPEVERSYQVQGTRVILVWLCIENVYARGKETGWQQEP